MLWFIRIRMAIGCSTKAISLFQKKRICNYSLSSFGSFLTAVGELLMFGVIAQIPRILDAVRNGKSFKFQKGDSSVEISASGTQESY